MFRYLLLTIQYLQLTVWIKACTAPYFLYCTINHHWHFYYYPSPINKENVSGSTLNTSFKVFPVIVLTFGHCHNSSKTVGAFLSKHWKPKVICDLSFPGV